MNTKILISKCQRFADRFMHYWWCYPLIAFLSFFINAYFKKKAVTIITFAIFLFSISVSAIALLMIIISILTTLFKERTRADAFMRYWWCYPLICIGSFAASLYLHLTYPKIIVPFFMMFVLFGCLSLLALFIGVVQNRIGAFFQHHKTQIAHLNRYYLGWILPLLTLISLFVTITFTPFMSSTISVILILLLIVHIVINLKQRRFGAAFKAFGLFVVSFSLSIGIFYGSLLLFVRSYMSENNKEMSVMERTAFLQYVEGKKFEIPDFMQYNILEYATIQYPKLDVPKNGRKITLQGQQYWEMPVFYQDKVFGISNVYFTMDGIAVGLRKDNYKWDLTTLVPDNQNKLLPRLANTALSFLVFIYNGKSQQSIAIGVGKMLEY